MQMTRVNFYMVHVWTSTWCTCELLRGEYFVLVRLRERYIL